MAVTYILIKRIMGPESSRMNVMSGAPEPAWPRLDPVMEGPPPLLPLAVDHVTTPDLETSPLADLIPDDLAASIPPLTPPSGLSPVKPVTPTSNPGLDSVVGPMLTMDQGDTSLESILSPCIPSPAGSLPGAAGGMSAAAVGSPASAIGIPVASPSANPFGVPASPIARPLSAPAGAVPNSAASFPSRAPAATPPALIPQLPSPAAAASVAASISSFQTQTLGAPISAPALQTSSTNQIHPAPANGAPASSSNLPAASSHPAAATTSTAVRVSTSTILNPTPGNITGRPANLTLTTSSASKPDLSLAKSRKLGAYSPTRTTAPPLVATSTRAVVTQSTHSSTTNTSFSSSTTTSASNSQSASRPSTSSFLNGGTAVQQNSNSEEDDNAEDVASRRGVFGWETIDNTNIPTIFRHNKPHVSVRMVEEKILRKYPNIFPDKMKNSAPLHSFYITDNERKLLNEINIEHCNFEFGHAPFTSHDVVVRLDDFIKFYDEIKKTFSTNGIHHFPTVSTSQRSAASTTSQPVRPALNGGWVQLNNTISPFVFRVKSKYVPMNIVRISAALMVSPSLSGDDATPSELDYMNLLCKQSSIPFSFESPTKMIDLDLVQRVSKARVVELPTMKDPMSYAKYLSPEQLRDVSSGAQRPSVQAQQQNGVRPSVPQRMPAPGVRMPTQPTPRQQAPRAPMGQVQAPGGRMQTPSGVRQRLAAQMQPRQQFRPPVPQREQHPRQSLVSNTRPAMSQPQLTDSRQLSSMSRQPFNGGQQQQQPRMPALRPFQRPQRPPQPRAAAPNANNSNNNNFASFQQQQQQRQRLMQHRHQLQQQKQQQQQQQQLQQQRIQQQQQQQRIQQQQRAAMNQVRMNNIQYLQSQQQQLRTRLDAPPQQQPTTLPPRPAMPRMQQLQQQRPVHQQQQQQQPRIGQPLVRFPNANTSQVSSAQPNRIPMVNPQNSFAQSTRSQLRPIAPRPTPQQMPGPSTPEKSAPVPVQMMRNTSGSDVVDLTDEPGHQKPASPEATPCRQLPDNVKYSLKFMPCYGEVVLTLDIEGYGEYCNIDELAKKYFVGLEYDELTYALRKVLGVSLLSCSQQLKYDLLHNFDMNVTPYLLSMDSFKKYLPQLKYMFECTPKVVAAMEQSSVTNQNMAGQKRPLNNGADDSATKRPRTEPGQGSDIICLD